MNKPNTSTLLNRIQRGISKHSPQILLGVGIAGMVTTTILAVKATPKALEKIEEKKEELEVDKLTPVETVKATWKCYIPAATTGVTSVACLLGANSVHVKRNAALATVYKLSETAFTEYREKVAETFGEKKELAVKDKISEDRMKTDPVSKSTVIVTGKGNTLCYDVASGRYFNSDIEQIRKAENAINKVLLNNMYVSLNDWYDELDLDHTSVGYDLGWNLDDGLIDIYFSSQISDEDVPCIVINYRTPPKYDYSSFL